MNKIGKLSFFVFALGFSLVSLWAPQSFAEIEPQKIHVATQKKTQIYILDGLITGGDSAVNEVIVKDIRRAVNNGFERVAIDLSANRDGEAVALSRPPYFQVSATPEERRLMVTLRAKTKLAFNPKKIISEFKKSPIVTNIILLPVLDENSWSFVLEFKAEHSVEVFELSSPVRIIVDVRTSKAKRQLDPSES